jgi:radical SAM superfamily enzyme YgiQ (UPF0313 family)
MKILFIQSKTDNPEGPIFPIGLAYLAAVLKERFRVKVLDMNIVDDPYQEIECIGKSFQPDIIGLSIRNIKVARPGEHVSSGLEIQKTVRKIRQLIPKVAIIAGGAGFSLYAGPFLQLIPEIDYGIIGEGELALPEFLTHYPDPVGIRGIVYRRKGEIIFQGTADRPDFSKLPWPQRNILPIETYSRYQTSVGVMTKRGCPYRCIHCSDLYLFGKTVRLRKPESVVEELRYLKDEFRISHFMFSDQEFNTPAKYTKKLLRRMIDANLDLKWTAYFTPESLDREMVVLFKRAGCDIVNFSPDCCSNTMMKQLNKGYTMRAVFRANKLLKEVGLPVTYNFMLGLPGQRLVDLLQTIRFVLMTKMQLKKLFKLHGLFMVPVRIYPWTQLKETAIKNGYISDDDDLMRPRFFRPSSDFVHLANRAVLTLIEFLWKVKHRVR